MLLLSHHVHLSYIENGLCHIKSDVRNGIFTHRLQNWHEWFFDNLRGKNLAQLSHTEESCESVQVVTLSFQIKKSCYYVFLSPLWSENNRKLFKIFNRSDPNWINRIVKPFEAHRNQLFCEKLLSQLFGQSRELLDHRELNPPILIFTEILECRYDRLLKILQSNNAVELLQSLE